MDIEPGLSSDVVYVAFPPESDAVPRVLDPFLKVTNPVAEEGLTVTVKITDVP